MTDQATAQLVIGLLLILLGCGWINRRHKVVELSKEVRYLRELSAIRYREGLVEGRESAARIAEDQAMRWVAELIREERDA
jgi:hypothetical protein